MSAIVSIGLKFQRAAHWLGPEWLHRAHTALTAHEDRKYSGAVADGAACLESVLKALLVAWNLSVPEAATLGPLIGRVRDSGRAPGELLERLNEAVVIRNRAVHDRPAKLIKTQEADAFMLLSDLGLIVEWSLELIGSSDEYTPQEAVPVFLSVGTPHRLDQVQFLYLLREKMRALGVELRTLTAAVFDENSPFYQLADILAECQGVLVVGLERSHAYTVFEKEHSLEETLQKDRYIPTAWNQIEGSMAAALKLPVLVLRDKRLVEEGIFEASNHRHRIFVFDLHDQCRNLSEELSGFLAGWVQCVRVEMPKKRIG